MIEKLYAAEGYSIFSTAKPRRRIRAKKSEELFETVTDNAAQIGLAVNEKKTQMIWATALTEANDEVFIGTRSGLDVNGQASLMVLGFYFGETPGVVEQVQQLKRKYRAS